MFYNNVRNTIWKVITNNIEVLIYSEHTSIFVRCPNFLFRCKYGACVSKNSKCNGIKDCADGSDETSECQISSSSVPANRPNGSCQ